MSTDRRPSRHARLDLLPVIALLAAAAGIAIEPYGLKFSPSPRRLRCGVAYGLRREILAMGPWRSTAAPPRCYVGQAK
jgi:hypothetical protein